MLKMYFRTIFPAAILMLSAWAAAQTLTVTSPQNGEFLGLNNTLTFNITGATVQVNVKATITGPGATTFNVEQDFTPNADGKIEGSLPLNFNQGTIEGAYTIAVVAKNKDTQNVFGNANINVNLDLTKPKFYEFNPISGTTIKGVIPITVKVIEPNFKDYRVQVNGSDIPNNTGTSLVNNSFTVFWDTNGIQFDGSQSITVRLRDLANNEETRTISVTLDRVPPSVIIVQPVSNVKLAPRSNISVAVDVTDQTANGVHVTGVDVVAKREDGSFLARIPRQSFKVTTGNTLRWAGRLRYKSSFPKKIKIVVNVIDRAGNVAATQEILVEYK